MNNKFESKSEAEARQYLTEMFEAGKTWGDGTTDIDPLDAKYYFCKHGEISHSDEDKYWDRYSHLPTYKLKNPPKTEVLTPDFSELKAVREAISTLEKDLGLHLHTKEIKVLIDYVKPMLPIDPYSLHGVTREDVKKYAEAVELLQGEAVKSITWSAKGWGFARIKNDNLIRIRPLNRPAPYPHWETPIILGGE